MTKGGEGVEVKLALLGGKGAGRELLMDSKSTGAETGADWR